MRLRKSITIITFLSLLLLIGCSKQQPTPTPPQTPQNSTQTPPVTTPPVTTPPTGTAPVQTQVGGAALFVANCVGCHGALAIGIADKGPALNTDEWKNNSPKVQDIIKKGQGTMPGFSGKLSDTQVKDIGDYVASLKK